MGGTQPRVLRLASKAVRLSISPTVISPVRLFNVARMAACKLGSGMLTTAAGSEARRTEPRSKIAATKRIKLIVFISFGLDAMAVEALGLAPTDSVLELFITLTCAVAQQKVCSHS